MDEPQYIDTSEALNVFCDSIKPSPWLAIDTEFRREKTYYSELALIQIATPEMVAIIDPLACDINPLLDVLYDENIIKVFHAARQDQEIFYDMRGAPLSPVFDTQIAAPILGHPEQAGYARLVDDILGVQLSKAHSRTDWIRRPLSQDQLHYAADDVIYLAKLYPILESQLKEKKRFNWIQPSFHKLSDAKLYANPPNLAWKRIRQTKRLKGTALSIVQHLAEWRETLAQQKNIPRGWLLKDDILVELAKLKPMSVKAIADIKGISEKFSTKYGGKIHQIIQHAIEQKPSAADKPKRSKKSSDRAEALADLLMAQVRLASSANGINPTSVTSRKELIELVYGDRELELLGGWRAELVGDALLETLKGNKRFYVTGDQLIIESS
ncbi:MAG: ribonuclease D [Cycloclasticus sp. symbiont of Poecilosclerida sp. M]|nr:MAG: ribonuclease D [Cycloclasticus sp. symbiont of Poecilosclerida sp. M]